MFSKIDVNGDSADPLFKYLKDAKKEEGLLGMAGNDIKWNFGKFLVGKDGKVIERYAPTSSPLSIEGDIKKAIAA